MSGIDPFYRVTIRGADGEPLIVTSVGPTTQQFRWAHPTKLAFEVLIELMAPVMDREPGLDQQVWAADEDVRR